MEDTLSEKNKSERLTKPFIVDGIGYDIVMDFPGALFSSHNGYHHHIGMNTWNETDGSQPAPNSVGLNWFSLVFPDQGKREETLERLRGMKTKIMKAGSDFLVEDPSGNTIRLVIG